MGKPFPLFCLKDRPLKGDIGTIAPESGGTLWPAVVQAILVVAAAGGMMVAPPATGRMLLVPLNGDDRNALARLATDAGVALVDAGPFADSLIVSGDRSALMGAMVQGRMLVLRAAAGGCGSTAKQGQG